MVFGMKHTCPNCGASNQKDARFCVECGRPLAGGVRRCGACGVENAGDAVFCKNCGHRLSESAAADIYHNRWTRSQDEFAVRIDSDDLPGLLKKGVNVDVGTNALLIENGANRGVVPPGAYTLSSFGDKFKDVFSSGIPKQMTILLVNIAPTDMDFHLGGIFTKDPLQVGISIRMQVEVKEPGKFLINVLQGRERYSVEDLRQYLYPEVVAVADGWVRSHTAQELADDLSLKSKFELALEEAIKRTFAQSGLRFLQVRTAEINLEALDKIKGIRSKYALQISEAEAEAQGKKRLVDAQRELDLSALAEETAKVELEERKVDLYERMRRAVMSDKINEVRSEADFKAFMREIDREELLSEKEKNELLRTWKEEAEDYDRARAFLLAKLEIEQKSQLQIIELKQRKDLELEKLDYEIELTRKKANFEFELKQKLIDEEIEIERKKNQIAKERAEAQIEIEALKSEQARGQRQEEWEEEQRDVERAMKLYEWQKQIKRLDKEANLAIERQHKLELLAGIQKLELERWEAQERQRAADREYELNRIRELSKLSVEALISVSPADQGRILSDLKKTEILKGMTEDQILALAAKDSPQVAQALQEKFKAIADGQVGEKEKELYERLLGEKKEAFQKLQEESDKRVRDVTEANRQAQETSRHAMDRLSETAQAFAKGSQNQPVIVVGGSGVSGHQIVTPDVNPVSQTKANAKVCPKCGNFQPVDTKFCNICGQKFEGVG